MARKLSDDEREMYEEFVYKFPFCWGCGIDPTHYRDVQRERLRVDYPRWIERHHICKMCRVHARWNLFNACKLCHDLIELHTVREDLEKIPYLRFEHVLWLKQCFDPEHYDPEQLQKYSLKRLPEPQIPDPWFLKQLVARGRTKLDLAIRQETEPSG